MAPVGIRIEPGALMFFDSAPRVLLRTRPNPMTWKQVSRFRGARPAGPPPRPPSEPIRVQRRASATGVIMVCRQKIALGRACAGQTLVVAVSDNDHTPITQDHSGRSVRRPMPSKGYPRLRTSQTVIIAKAVASAASAAPVITWKYQKRSAGW